jgi:hypothetical protein
MQELISQPGLQFYVLRLSGTLTYTFTIAGRPPKSFELSDADCDDAESLMKSDETPTIQGTDASAVGLSLTIIKNIGKLEVRFKGKDEATAHWTFDGLKEIGSKLGMYASVGTQTCIVSINAKVKPATHRRLIDSATEAFLFRHSAKITSVICESGTGTLWKVSKGGLAELIHGQSLTDPKTGHCLISNADTPVQDNQVSTTQATPIATRCSTRKRARDAEHISFASAQTLPRYLYLSGITDSKKKTSKAFMRGHLRVDRVDKKIAFWTSSYQLLEDIDPDTSGECVSPLIKRCPNIHRYCHVGHAR